MGAVSATVPRSRFADGFSSFRRPGFPVPVDEDVDAASVVGTPGAREFCGSGARSLKRRRRPSGWLCGRN